MTDHILIGGGALAREILEWFSPQLALSGDRFVGYLDDTGEAMAPYGAPLPWLGPIKDHSPDDRPLVMAIADPAARAGLGADLKARGGRLARLLHSQAWISASAIIGDGAVFGPFSHASTGSKSGELVLVNTFSGVGHDASLGLGGCLSSHVDLTGGVNVGDRVFFGSGARLLPGLKVGDDARIGAGAVVVRNVASGAIMYAAPARRLS
ncbi:MAG: acetyltransferase [Brevundimonas sp.]|nr:MAG: acetyltransferase [Brevundimonas sp.]